jgi:hypothetical protein
VCDTNKNINKNKDDIINTNSFFRGKYSSRFENNLCDIPVYSMDEYVQWLPVTTDDCNTVLVPLYAN